MEIGTVSSVPTDSFAGYRNCPSFGVPNVMVLYPAKESVGTDVYKRQVADTPEKQRMYLQKAVDKTVLIGTMIEDLLLYSKLDLNQLPFDMERVNICLLYTSFSAYRFNEAVGNGKLGVVASGIGAAYTKEVMDAYGLDLKFLKIATPFPLPEALILDFLDVYKRQEQH